MPSCCEDVSGAGALDEHPGATLSSRQAGEEVQEERQCWKQLVEAGTGRGRFAGTYRRVQTVTCKFLLRHRRAKLLIELSSFPPVDDIIRLHTQPVDSAQGRVLDSARHLSAFVPL